MLQRHKVGRSISYLEQAWQEVVTMDLLTSSCSLARQIGW